MDKAEEVGIGRGVNKTVMFKRIVNSMNAIDTNRMLKLFLIGIVVLYFVAYYVYEKFI